jgi:hypothetical protein
VLVAGIPLTSPETSPCASEVHLLVAVVGQIGTVHAAADRALVVRSGGVRTHFISP